LFLYRLRKRLETVVAAVGESAHGVESCSPKSWCASSAKLSAHTVLAALRASLNAEGDPPSKRLARLNRLMELLDSREHMLVRMLERVTGERTQHFAAPSR